MTEQSLIWQGQYKYFFSSDSPFGFNGWSERNNSMVPVKEGVAPTCTNCLFDLLADPTEMRDISGCVHKYHALSHLLLLGLLPARVSARRLPACPPACLCAFMVYNVQT